MGFSRGSCRMYNYFNGSLICDLLSDATAEIKAIRYNSRTLKEPVLICAKSGTHMTHLISMTPRRANTNTEQLVIASGWNCVTWIWAIKSKQVRS